MGCRAIHDSDTNMLFYFHSSWTVNPGLMIVVVLTWFAGAFFLSQINTSQRNNISIIIDTGRRDGGTREPFFSVRVCLIRPEPVRIGGYI